MSLKYIILNVSEITDEIISTCLETSRDTLKTNKDGSKTFVKFRGDIPSSLSGKTILNHSQILEELSKDSWKKDI